jgi:ABC-type transport system involved in multi-copper enzyme maturation permease subunit
MTTGTVSVPRAHAAAGADAWRAGFGLLLRSEWTKFRTVRGWVIGMFIAALLTVFVGLFAAGNGSSTCHNSPSGPVLSGKACLPYIPHGPGGEVVTDSFNFTRQPLTGNGSITVRVLSLSGAHPDFGGNGGVPAGGSGPTLTPGLMPWSKAGIIIKQDTKQGSAYAAMMVTGSNGVRMQYNYTGDIAGLPGSVSAARPRWLRLTRAGDTITGYDSADGTHWTKVGTVQLADLPATVQAGMFATSPGYVQTSTSFGGSSNQGAPSQATGVFGDVTVSGTSAGGTWAATAVGGGGPISVQAGPAGHAGTGARPRAAGFTHDGGTFTVTGSGDIAPVVPGPGSTLPTATIEQSLAGAFIGLIAIVVVAAMFFTAEYRRGLIRTTLAATPRRGQVLAAKAIVAAAAAFVVGLVASVVAISVGVPLERDNGSVVLPVSALTEVRVVVGTAALLAVVAAFAVGLAVLRRSAAAITIAVATVVLPFLLSALNILPSGPAAWLLRITPAAGLAIQQSVPQYHQVTSVYSPAGGYYPLPPFAGFGVLCCWAAAALALAYVLLRRRDA